MMLIKRKETFKGSAIIKKEKGKDLYGYESRNA